jgi:surface antigen
MKRIPFGLIAFVSLSFVPVPSPADPPPWAPAHGWRKKNDPNYVGYTGKKWDKDYGVIDGRCNTEEVGAVLGGVVGGVVGSRASDRNRPIAIVAGTVIGAVIGAKIGRSIDDTDRGCMGHALELAGENNTVVWTNQATGVTYQLTPTRNFGDKQNPCREFRTIVSVGQKRDSIAGSACRRGNGEWAFSAPEGGQTRTGSYERRGKGERDEDEDEDNGRRKRRHGDD